MAEQNQQNKNEEKDLNQLLKVRREKLKDLQDNGKDPFQITKFDVTAHSSEIKDNFEQMDGKEVTIAGRMMSKRVMGKASFCNVQDLKGRIQIYVARGLPSRIPAEAADSRGHCDCLYSLLAAHQCDGSGQAD